ncbi:type IV secretory system conjugative DNA transfer family protein [Armatimonas sp.]|uniref:type IV secretory system conjugative DNA transfer family protein n=1 Tax=Armatimonas sp. TaxID=1872638 RepID=UPI0037517531
MSSLPFTLPLGEAVTEGPGDGLTTLQTDSYQLKPHLEKPWLRAYLKERITGGDIKTENDKIAKSRNGQSASVCATAHALQRHSVLFGSTGMGKSRLMRHVIREQLQAGCSLIAMDPKDETIQDLLDVAREVGIPAEKVTLLRPLDKKAPIPGWNPLLAVADSVESSARDLTDLMKSIFHASWGVQLSYFLRNALVVMATHKLTLTELQKFLTQEDYREQLIRIPVVQEDPVAYTKACECFLEDFTARSKGERSSAVAPILNKIQGFIANAYLAALLCPKRQTLHLDSLWSEQRLVLVHLDESILGDEGAQLLGGMIAHFALRSAFRVGEKAKRHVILSLDELGVQEKFIGPTVVKAVRIGRSYKIRLLLAGQDFEQMSPDLRTTVLSSPSVKIFFRLGYNDARYVAASLAAGTQGHISKITLSAVPRSGRKNQVEQVVASHEVLDGSGTPVIVPEGLWCFYSGTSTEPSAVKRFFDELGAWAGRLYVRCPYCGQGVAVHRYIEGVPEKDYWLGGPDTLELHISFPEPKVVHVERLSKAELEGVWLRKIQDLEIQYAVVKVAEAPAQIVRAVDVVDRPATAQELEVYRVAALRANGQSQEEIRAVAQWRTNQILMVAGGLAKPASAGNENAEFAKESLTGRSPKSRAKSAPESLFDHIPEPDHVSDSIPIDIVEPGASIPSGVSDSSSEIGATVGVSRKVSNKRNSRKNPIEGVASDGSLF